MPWPSTLKRWVLRLFGARVGRGVVIKPRVNIKYPWNLSIGSASWIGEDSCLDSLGHITVGADVCVSQGCLIETGNHDWSKTSFDLVVKEVVLEDGSWAAARSVLLPGSRLSTHSVLSAGGVLSKTSEPYSIYSGNPAVKVGDRRLKSD
jgi:putative colanic acid biosynthesis acetyltransferase WcaF